MAVNDEHPEYEARIEQWQKMRDCAAGQEKIHEQGAKYLPRLSGQTDQEYKAYLKRALFYGATARTIDGLSGMIFRKAPTFEVPEAFAPMLEDLTLEGTGIIGFAEDVVDDDLTVGRAGIMVDYPSVSPNTTVAQARQMNIRPFMKLYSAENIFNWRTETRNNALVLTQVRLWEIVEIPGDDEFEFETRKQIRVLDLDESGRYRQRVFIKVKPVFGFEEWVQDGDDIIPLKNGQPLSEIPFFFVGVKNSRPTVEKPPLLDLANANLSHYLTTADLEHGAHFTGLPTAVIIGHQPDTTSEQEYRIGAATAWIFPDSEADAKFLEFTGSGLETLEKRAEKKEQYMAFLGARMLTPEKKAVETAETAQIHRVGETSVLASLAQSAGDAIESALKFMVEWAGFDSSNVTFSLNKDFAAVDMSAQELTALMGLWQSGGIAFADLLDNLKRGQIVRDDRSADDIRSEVEQENPFNSVDMEGAENDER